MICVESPDEMNATTTECIICGNSVVKHGLIQQLLDNMHGTPVHIICKAVMVYCGLDVFHAKWLGGHTDLMHLQGFYNDLGWLRK